jgi:hypothetical protein
LFILPAANLVYNPLSVILSLITKSDGNSGCCVVFNVSLIALPAAFPILPNNPNPVCIRLPVTFKAAFATFLVSTLPCVVIRTISFP